MHFTQLSTLLRSFLSSKKCIVLDKDFRKKGQGYNLTKMPDFYQNFLNQKPTLIHSRKSMNALNSAFDFFEIVFVL